MEKKDVCNHNQIMRWAITINLKNVILKADRQKKCGLLKDIKLINDSKFFAIP